MPTEEEKRFNEDLKTLNKLIGDSLRRRHNGLVAKYGYGGFKPHDIWYKRQIDYFVNEF